MEDNVSWFPRYNDRFCISKHLLNHIPNMVLHHGKSSQPYSPPVWAQAYVRSRLSLVSESHTVDIFIPICLPLIILNLPVAFSNVAMKPLATFLMSHNHSITMLMTSYCLKSLKDLTYNPAHQYNVWSWTNRTQWLLKNSSWVWTPGSVLG